MSKFVTKIESSTQLEDLDLSCITPSRNPLRRELGELSSLMASIAEKGLLQPILVRPNNNTFEIVCGHRRYAACKKLKMKQIPCIIEYLSDQKAFEASLVENVQRQGLDAIDEARAYQKYVLEFGWGSITKLARKIGKSEEYVSHRLLLLDLPEEIRAKVANKSLSTSKAREFVWLREPNKQKEMLKAIMDRNLSSRKLHEAVSLVKKGIDVKDAVDQVDTQQAWTRYIRERPDPDSMLMQKAIVALRISMMRIDGVIEEVRSDLLKEYLIETRYRIHQLIDGALKKNKELWGQV